ncbi:hypothetical protein GCM10010193_70440 [Kitasatospora atroaurantiaca]|uniref:Uncharacterized protein n=1 Tax=Kitasatospora atroaurantiaca TaxID=285545 RepID=A0A561ENJ1_9ACTN|nr:hypothetical protein [Kitasatospora atroaurantiaca]TWE17129.1 hypothetical protein FB465_2134 [Kitasatospora atroaurantiaca]
MSTSRYFFDSLVPSWLGADPGYRAALGQHLLGLMALQEYEPVSEPAVSVAPCDIDPPPGTVLLRVEVLVEEFDLDMGDEEPVGQWLAEQTDERTVHCVPLDDAVSHDLTDDCPCGPRSRPEECRDGSTGWVVIHHSLDGRELTEPDHGASPE